MENTKEENEEQNIVVSKCSDILRPTSAPPGGSVNGKWVCNEKLGQWEWQDTIA